MAWCVHNSLSCAAHRIYALVNFSSLKVQFANASEV